LCEQNIIRESGDETRAEGVLPSPTLKRIDKRLHQHVHINIYTRERESDAVL
jgi:hypothetical protein